MARPRNLGHGEAVEERPKALRVYLEDLGESIWIPKSVFHDDSDVWESEGQEGDVVVAEWWANNEGLGG